MLSYNSPPDRRNKPVACVIPAYNEAAHITRVLDVVCQVGEIQHIIVVDDGSRDETAAIVREYAIDHAQVSLLCLPQNQGKAGAMFAGAETSPCDLVLFLDADLVGLRPEHIRDLISPVRSGACTMSKALFTHGRWQTDWEQLSNPFLSGQRCLVWSVYRSIPEFTNARYGAEIALTLHALSRREHVITVPWQGMTHVMQSERHGITGGWASAWRMYRQIARYFWTYCLHRRGQRRASKQIRPRRRVFALSQQPRLLLALVLLVLTSVASLSGNAEIAAFDPHPVELIPLSLDGYERLLVVAPHPDDETLGTGGLITSARRAGMEISVVIVTNGDGNLVATLEQARRLYPRPRDAKRLGVLRQHEALEALGHLGINSDQVAFLGYPDGGLAHLWWGHWATSSPYRSRYSGAKANPYPVTYNPGAPYAGEQLLDDLTAIITSYKPDLIAYPHPNDTHPDHWAVANFVRLALVQIELEDPSYQPAGLTYLVHRPDFPNPKGLSLGKDLEPPRALLYPNVSWYRLDMDEQQILEKKQALKANRSQTIPTSSFLYSFVRQNELLAYQEPASLPYIQEADWLKPSSWEDTQGNNVGPVQFDAIRDVARRDTNPATDIAALYAARRPDDALQLCLQMRGDIAWDLTYTIRLKAVGPEGIISREVVLGQTVPKARRPKVAHNIIGYTYPLSELGHPRVLFIEAEVKGSGFVLDQTAWQVVWIALYEN